MQFPRELFQRAGLNTTDAANMFNVSRVTGWRWMCGRDGAGVNSFLRRQVARQAEALGRAVEDGALPDPDIAKLHPSKRLLAIRRVLRAYRVTK